MSEFEVERDDSFTVVTNNILRDKLYVSFHDYRKISDVIGFDYSNNKFFLFE